MKSARIKVGARKEAIGVLKCKPWTVIEKCQFWSHHLNFKNNTRSKDNYREDVYK